MLLRDLLGEGAGDVAVTSLAYDNRACPRARCSSACPASRATATTSRRTRSRAARPRWWSRRPLGLGVPEVLVDDVRAAMALAAAALLRRSDRAPAGRRHHRHERQDDDRVPRALAARGRRPAVTGLLGTVKSVVGGEERAVVRTTPEAIDLQRTFAEMLGGRRRGVRDGGLLARARAAPRRRDPLGGRGLHEPHPGPPRLPSGHGGLLPGQAAAVRGRRPGVRIVNVDDPSGRRLADEFPGTVGFGIAAADADLPRRRPARRADGLGVHRALARRRDAVRLPLPGRFNVLNALGALARSRGRSAWRRATIAAALADGRARAGPLRARRRGPAVRGARRLRAHAGLARERAARRARAGRRAA